MPSRKKLDELEYVVMGNKKNDDINISAKMGTGCFSVLCAVLLTVLIAVGIVAVSQINSSRPSAHCAVTGCTNKVKSGSNYCWLHSSSYGNKIRRNSSYNNNDVSPTEKPSSRGGKIWSGSTGRNDAPQSGSLIN